MDGQPATVRDEWRRYSPLVKSAFLAMSFYSLFAYSNQIFGQPLENEFGWPGLDIAFGYSMFPIIAFLMGPLVGSMIDRFGAQRIAVPGLALSALGPPIAAAVYDAFHTFHPLLWAALPSCLFGGFLMLFLGKYPEFAKRQSSRDRPDTKFGLIRSTLELSSRTVAGRLRRELGVGL